MEKWWYRGKPQWEEEQRDRGKSRRMKKRRRNQEKEREGKANLLISLVRGNSFFKGSIW